MDEEKKKDIKSILKYVIGAIALILFLCVFFSLISMCQSCTTVQTGHSQPAPSQVNFNTSNSIEK